jgi:tRNA (adenine37-N6)-methyltransferase
MQRPEPAGKLLVAREWHGAAPAATRPYAMQPRSSDIFVTPVAFVRGGRTEPRDDHWDVEVATIELVDALGAETLDGIDAFSHVEVVYLFHQVDPARPVEFARHPRGNTNWPRVGLFAQRGKDRPNRIGVSVARLLRRNGRTIEVAGLDAIDGTPVLDIKPVMAEFLPRGELRQPDWSHELMREYWR